MTLEQLMSPQVTKWLKDHNKRLNEGYKCTNEEFFNEFEKWLDVHESEINESIEKSKSLNEGRFSSMFDDDEDEDGDVESERKTEIIEPDTDDSETDSETEIEDEDDTISFDPRSKFMVDNSKSKRRNVFKVVNRLYKKIEKENLNLDKDTYLKFLDTSNVNDMTALLAFTNLPNVDLSTWDTSGVRHMEGMFYKSTFNNDSICEWNVSSCDDFKNMFLGSKFNQSLSKWKPKMRITREFVYDDETGEKRSEEVEKRAPLPFVGAYEDEEEEEEEKFWDERLKGGIKESVKSKYTHLLDFESFVISEGLIDKTKDFIKKGFNKVKDLFKTVALKVSDWFITFVEDGKPVAAVSPYTTLNYLALGKVDGVNAYSPVKNNLLNDNVSETPELMPDKGYYESISKDSNEYKNFETFIQMLEESKNKNVFGEIIEEDRVGFSAKSGGLKGVKDIDSRRLKEYIEDQIFATPNEMGKDALKPILIWGAPGVGKSTIPNTIIRSYNESNPDKKKALVVVECGDMTVDGFALPIPDRSSLKEFISDRPNVKKIASKLGLSDGELDNIQVVRSNDIPKMWLPAYKPSSDNNLNEINKAIANGWVNEYWDNDGEYHVEETVDGGLIMFDEFFRADPSIFKIIMQILLNRKVGNTGYVIGDKWGIIACSNRPNDDEEVSLSFSRTGAVVTTRFRAQYNFIPDFKDWKKWAEKEGHFDELTLSFLTSKKDSKGEYVNWHNIDAEEHIEGEVAHPTPRSWSELMKSLYVICKRKKYKNITEIPRDILEDNVYGAIGETVGKKYVDWIFSKEDSVLNMTKVFEDPSYVIPEPIPTAAEMSEKVVNYIETNYSTEDLPKEEYLINMFNLLNKTYSKTKDNYIKQMHIDILEKLLNKSTSKQLKKYYDMCVDRYQVND